MSAGVTRLILVSVALALVAGAAPPLVSGKAEPPVARVFDHVNDGGKPLSPQQSQPLLREMVDDILALRGEELRDREYFLVPALLVGTFDVSALSAELETSEGVERTTLVVSLDEIVAPPRGCSRRIFVFRKIPLGDYSVRVYEGGECIASGE